PPPLSACAASGCWLPLMVGGGGRLAGVRNLFVERLWPSVAALAVGVLIGCALGLVVWLPWPRLGFLVGAVACCGIVAALLASSSRIAVTAGDEASGQEAMLEAGGARIEVG